MTESKQRTLDWLRGFVIRAKAAGLTLEPLSGHEQTMLGVFYADVLAQQPALPAPLWKAAECA